jgi:two-component sensor histidine kinase
MYKNVAVHEFGVPVAPIGCLPPREADEFLLLREMHHRLANSFAVLAGLLRREFASASPDLERSIGRCEARIVAFGNLHRLLIVGTEGDWISLRFYVERLCEALAAALLRPLGVRCEVYAEEGTLPGERCELLGLIIAELVTNAAKHAFSGRNEGRVRIEVFKAADSWVCTVSDNGIGIKMAPGASGSKILEQLVDALGGTIVRKSERKGTAVVVTWQN